MGPTTVFQRIAVGHKSARIRVSPHAADEKTVLTDDLHSLPRAQMTFHVPRIQGTGTRKFPSSLCVIAWTHLVLARLCAFGQTCPVMKGHLEAVCMRILMRDGTRL